MKDCPFCGHRVVFSEGAGGHIRQVGITTGGLLSQGPLYIYIQWGQYVFDPLANYENWLLVEKGTEHNFTCLFI